MADVITNVGRTQAAGYLSNTVTQITTYYGNIGTGAGSAAVGDTTLVHRDRFGKSRNHPNKGNNFIF